MDAVVVADFLQGQFQQDCIKPELDFQVRCNSVAPALHSDLLGYPVSPKVRHLCSIQLAPSSLGGCDHLDLGCARNRQACHVVICLCFKSPPGGAERQSGLLPALASVVLRFDTEPGNSHAAWPGTPALV